MNLASSLHSQPSSSTVLDRTPAMRLIWRPQKGPGTRLRALGPCPNVSSLVLDISLLPPDRVLASAAHIKASALFNYKTADFL
ncbi:hypothetical protein SK128_026765 [Halocaridina rubra]|uniref:Uncharacterized protein n=1 Tax=Halocaridina rubra TaxID=373956 RepID=A0AAN8WH17_HALRR